MDFSSLTPLEGGWSGQTLLAEAGDERSVVRVYPPDGRRAVEAPEVDAAVLRLVRGLVPVPEVLEVRRGDVEAGRPGVLVTGWVEGERGDLLLPTLGDDDLALVGTRVGDLAADLAGMPMLRPGPFVDAELRIGEWGADGLDGLPGFLERRLPELGHLAPTEIEGLRLVCDRAQDRLDEVGRTCLVHSDLNPKNLLIDPVTLEVAAVLDWEFAHAGSPYTDLGNLLRFDREPTYASAVLAAYADRRDTSEGDTLRLARAADLWALVDLATRRGQNPVATRADRLLRAIARERDASARPSWSSTREAEPR